MEKNSKIYVAGHRGLVGSAIVRNLKKKGYTNIIGRTHTELDLTNQMAVANFFKDERPDYVFLCAAKVGGIHINEIQPADFMYINLAIETNIINSAYATNIKKLLFMGSGCIYPRIVPQPIKEEYLLTAPLEKTNEAYAIAKIAGLKMCEFYNKQYGTNYISVMPCNLYGPGDNYNPISSHVIPALIKKFHDAKISAAPSVMMWGTGTAKREFLHIDDIADASVFLMENYNENQWINIGCGEDMSIKELGELIKHVVDFKGDIIFDPSYPDGTPRKLLDSSKLLSMGWKPQITLEEGLANTYKDYLINNKNYRQ
ncbi:GDP-L-fucose synthase family protein [Enterocloster lavalensis]|uniref:GDP-L-fucose synthase n=1 Tax=Enterocloster lavalensis TaxID=460384 RepID=A0A1I0HXS9_9FIRM|nr:GDP-L-fucose synthase [Enterocloster lavalensis]SET88194.1 GDP-L-fucose synthase [Enterocloster lavalensis]